MVANIYATFELRKFNCIFLRGDNKDVDGNCGISRITKPKRVWQSPFRLQFHFMASAIINAADYAGVSGICSLVKAYVH